jgi:hypothetical protein
VGNREAIRSCPSASRRQISTVHPSATEAIGFVENDKFVGTIQLMYDFDFSKMPAPLRYVLEARMGKIPPTAQMKGIGRFEVMLLTDI